MRNKSYTLLALAILYIHLVFFGRHFGGFHYDFDCFRNWASHIYNHGLTNTYTIWNNYMPVYQYIMYLFGKIAGSEEAIRHHIYYLKAFTLLFDFAALWYVYKWMDGKFDILLLFGINLLNFAFSYNTLLWGQADGIHSALAFISVYYACRNKILVSAVLYLLALNMKLQALIFLPVLGLIYLYQLIDKKKIKPFFYSALMLGCLQVLIVLPFMLQKEHGISLLLNRIKESFSQYPWLGDSNFWSLAGPAHNVVVNDQEIFMFGATYKNAGLILFFLFALVAMLPLIRTVFSRLQRKNVALPDKKVIWLICALVSVQFYFFNTEMHERYSHPALIFITAYSFYTRRFVPYVLYCFAYFLVLEPPVKFLQLPNYDFIFFNPVFRAVMFTLVLAVLYFELYRETFVQQKRTNGKHENDKQLITYEIDQLERI